MRATLPRATFALLLLLSPAGAAIAQPSASIALASDERRRGLSWSDGRAVVRAELSHGIAHGAQISATATSLRGSARHFGAEAAIDLAASWRSAPAAIQLDTGIVARLFPGGAGKRDFVEGWIGAGSTIGPVHIDLSASYAPSQAAIGGDNLYLAAQGTAALIGSPFSFVAHVGRSSGNTDNAARATRLRPDGRYHDWRIGVEHVHYRRTIGLYYIGTDIGDDGTRPRTHGLAYSGDTLLARLSFSF